MCDACVSVHSTLVDVCSSVIEQRPVLTHVYMSYVQLGSDAITNT